MSKCENCIHYDACEDWANIDNLNKLCFPFECEGDTKPCEFYKDKSLFVEVPSTDFYCSFTKSKIQECPIQDEVEKAKQEAYEEIFEEIDKIINNYTHKSYLPNSPLWCKEYRNNQIIAEIVELEKTYKGEQNVSSADK